MARSTKHSSTTASSELLAGLADRQWRDAFRAANSTRRLRTVSFSRCTRRSPLDHGVTFLLTAKGAISGKTAQTTFTDSLSGLFEIDGNALASTSHDWSQVWSDRTLGTHPTP
jgi:hypothetical protein